MTDIMPHKNTLVNKVDLKKRFLKFVFKTMLVITTNVHKFKMQFSQ